MAGQKSNNSIWQQHVRPWLLGLAIWLLIVGCAVLFVWTRIEVTRLEYRISQLSSTKRQLEQTHKKLALEKASLEDPGRIERIARQKLNMQDPRPQQIVDIR